MTSPSPEQILASATVVQVFYLLILAIGVLGLRAAFPKVQPTEGTPEFFKWLQANSYATSLIVIGSILAILSLLAPVFAEKRSAADTGFNGIYGQMAAVHAIYILNLAGTFGLILHTGGTGRSIFTSALTFLPTAMIFLTRSVGIASIYACVIILLFLLGHFAHKDHINVQDHVAETPALSIIMRTAFLLLTLYIAFRSAFRAVS